MAFFKAVIGKLAAVGLCLLLTGPGIALAQTDAYSVEVAVADRSTDEQQAAYSAGLRRILLNNSGDKTLLNRDAVRAGLRQAEQYVASFSYRMPPPGTVISSETPITESVRQTGQATQLMLVSFDRTLVRELIDGTVETPTVDEQDAEVAVAPRSNSALVWLLIQDDGRDIMISDAAAANVQSRAREIAGAAGLSLVYPAGDEIDQQNVTVADMQTADLDRITASSERYEQDTILVGHLSRQGARGWLGEWYRVFGDERVQSTFETGSLDEALQKGLSVLSAVEAVDQTYRYGGNAASDTEGLVWVGAVNSLSDYAQVMSFFDALPGVSTVYPKEVGETSMVFAVLPRSALIDIESAVVTQDQLRRTAPPVSDTLDSLSNSADLALEFSR